MMNSSEIIVVGGGASGLMATIAAAESGAASVCVIERLPRCGAKILVSGGGRCNLGNRDASAGHYHGGSQPFIRNVLRAFSGADAVRFFQSIGIEVCEEDSGRLFPRGGARRFLDAMVGRSRSLGVTFVTGARVMAIERTQDRFLLRLASGRAESHAVILAAGGCACPACGTDGAGLELAASLGHAIVPPVPALAPIDLKEPALAKLAGLAVEAEILLNAGDRTIARSRGSLLFTHTGISGPAALDLSREIGRHPEATLALRALPEQDADSAGRMVREGMQRHPRSQVATLLAEFLPERLAHAILMKADIAADQRLAQLNREQIQRIATALTALPMRVRRVQDFKAAHCTAGGVDLAHVRFQTMASRIVPGLFLAGELLDVDGESGGFNFQWAWSTGRIAGRAAAAFCKKA